MSVVSSVLLAKWLICNYGLSKCVVLVLFLQAGLAYTTTHNAPRHSHNAPSTGPPLSHNHCCGLVLGSWGEQDGSSQPRFAETDEPIDVPFRMWSWVGPRNNALSACGPDSPHENGQFLGRYRDTAASREYHNDHVVAQHVGYNSGLAALTRTSSRPKRCWFVVSLRRRALKTMLMSSDIGLEVTRPAPPLLRRLGLDPAEVVSRTPLLVCHSIV